MSEYDVIFFTGTGFDQSAPFDPFSEPHQPDCESCAIEHEHTQPVGPGECLFCMALTLSTDQAKYTQQSSPPSTDLTLFPPQSTSWSDLFPDLCSQTWLADPELQRIAQQNWEATIRWEMDQPSYPIHPGRTFASNNLGWNLQKTGATYDIVPLHTDKDGHGAGRVVDVGHWDPTKGAVTLKGDNYKSPEYYITVPALIITGTDESVQVVVPHSLNLTPRSNYDGSNIWWWVEEWLKTPFLEEEALMEEAPVIEASDDGSRKRKRED